MSAAMKEEEEEVAVVPLSGYRFLPTELELVRDYLYKKITNQKLPSDVPVVEYDIYSTEPWNLPVNNIIDTINTKRSYYFVKLLDGIHRCRRQRIVLPNHSNSHDDDYNGEGNGGYWKKIIAGGGNFTRKIRDEACISIGIKKSFTFYAYLSSSPAPGNHTTTNNNKEEVDGTTTTTTTTTTSTTMTAWKTNWIMDEYSLSSQRTQPWVLCILSKKGGGEEGDEIELLSKLKQVQRQQKRLQDSNHVHPRIELRLLELIKTTQERIKINQKQLWNDQFKLGMYTDSRVLLRNLKRKEIIAIGEWRLKQIKDEFSTGKITIEEAQELEKQFLKVYEWRKAKLEAEIAVIRSGSSYVVQLPSNFKRVRRGNMQELSLKKKMKTEN